MNEELKAYLGEMQRSITGHTSASQERVMERVNAAILASEDRVVERVVDIVVERVMARVDGRIDAAEDRMKTHFAEAIHASETKLLGEFWKWARTADARYRQNAGLTAGFSDRVSLVEDRVAELERGREAA